MTGIYTLILIAVPSCIVVYLLTRHDRKVLAKEARQARLRDMVLDAIKLAHHNTHDEARRYLEKALKVPDITSQPLDLIRERLENIDGLSGVDVHLAMRIVEGYNV